MLTFAYKVGGWVWQNAYVIPNCNLLHQKTLNNIFSCKVRDYFSSDDSHHFCREEFRNEFDFREWVGFQKSYVIFRVGHGKCLRPITRWVGGVKKGQKHAYGIFEWSLKVRKVLDFKTTFSLQQKPTI